MWGSVFQPSMHLVRPDFQDQAFCRSLSCTTLVGSYSHGTSINRCLSYSFSSKSILSGNSYAGLRTKPDSCLRDNRLRLYSSNGDGRNTGDRKQIPVNDWANLDSGNTGRERVREDSMHSDAHAWLGEVEQKEWFTNEKLAMECRNKESPFLTRREKFKNEFLRRIIPWEKIHVSWETFPYHINEHTKTLLVECVGSHLRHKKCTASHGARLTSSSGRILLQSVPGTELYLERIVRALARDMQVPLLVLDSSVVVPYDGDNCSSDCESDDDAESGEKCASESEIEDGNEAVNEEEWTSSNKARSDCSDDDDVVDVQVAAEAAFKNFVPNNHEEFEKRVSGESESSIESSKSQIAKSSDAYKLPLKKGDWVKYIGRSVSIKAVNRHLSRGQCGEVQEVYGDQIGVIFDVPNDSNKKLIKQPAKASVQWIDAKDIELVTDAEDRHIAVEALYAVLCSVQPLIVYFPDIVLWLSRACPESTSEDFFYQLRDMFDELKGPVVLICGQNKVKTGSMEEEKFTMMPRDPERPTKLPISLRHLIASVKEMERSHDNELYKLFTNVLCVYPPKEDDLLRTFNKQIEEDWRIMISRSNLNELHMVLEENRMSCVDFLHVDTAGVILTKQKAETVIGWAKNHYLSGCVLPSIKGERLFLPRESLEIAIMRLKEQETVAQKATQNFKNLAMDEYESNFISAVVPQGEIGVKFDDIGALEDVKEALNELVILPMRRPELFRHGNLLRPCKGVLLFGPPGTGKTLLAKALATEAGANFMSITSSTLLCKWYGDTEKLTKALFSYASRLAPVIIFVDEVDSLLGARGGAEHEATRRMRNEFMAAWDGLRTKDSQRILILGATNRPFDLDDAVIRRLPRRIFVDLPDAENRTMILRIFLSQENLEPDFQFDKLANATEGYSGSDLKNLCIAAAYRPVQELLEEEKQGCHSDVAPVLRPLNLDDFIQSKAKVSPSVAFDAASMNQLRKWNEQFGEGGSRRRSPFGFGN